MPSAQILTGPYGTNLEAGTPRDISHSGYRSQITQIARAGLLSGASVLTTDTFNLGRLNHGGSFCPKDFSERSKAYLAWAQGLAVEHRDIVGRILFALGPYEDCYSPEKAPSRAVAADFHDLRLGLLPLELEGPLREILLETICTAREAVGAALSYVRWQNRQPKSAEHLPFTTSFVVDEAGQLFDGTPVPEVIREITSLPGTSAIRFGINCSGLPGTIQALTLARRHSVEAFISTIYPNASDADVRLLDGTDEVVTAQDLPARARAIVGLAEIYPHLCRVGGCCGFKPVFGRN